ncbi:MAG: helix-turn-helix domain-containing protein [Firmicutes bacterium]|nr:helix-turn-helix domain-containing protein [Bacillota bacterium]
MDMVKIGEFLAELRKENGLTQDELGRKIGVSNKTVSRWETGTYLPPVEMLQILSDKYGVGINEILAAKRLDDKAYRASAESNIKTVLEKSVFTLKEKEEFFIRKWRKDHCAELIAESVILAAAAVVCAIFCSPLTCVVAVIIVALTLVNNNRKRAYVEGKLYDKDLKKTSKSDSDE